MLTRFVEPRTSGRLLDSEGEVILAEVPRHWVTRVVPSLLVGAGMAVLMSMTWLSSGWWLGLIVGLGLAGYGLFRIHLENMDRFVVTNMRVFRVHGVFNQHLATVPIARILDITVEQPLLGQLLNFGHFVFESAAQDQGLRRIEYVKDIDVLEKGIEKVIHKAGLRPKADPGDFDGT